MEMHRFYYGTITNLTDTCSRDSDLCSIMSDYIIISQVGMRSGLTKISYIYTASLGNVNVPNFLFLLFLLLLLIIFFLHPLEYLHILGCLVPVLFLMFVHGSSLSLLDFLRQIFLILRVIDEEGDELLILLILGEEDPEQVAHNDEQDDA